MHILIYVSIFVATDFISLYIHICIYILPLFFLYIYTLHLINNLRGYLSKEKFQMVGLFPLEKRRKNRT